MTHGLQYSPHCHDRHDALSTAVTILSRSPWRTIYSSGHTVTIAMTHSGHIVTIAIKQSPRRCISLRLAPIFLSYVISFPQFIKHHTRCDVTSLAVRQQTSPHPMFSALFTRSCCRFLPWTRCIQSICTLLFYTCAYLPWWFNETKLFPMLATCSNRVILDWTTI